MFPRMLPSLLKCAASQRTTSSYLTSHTLRALSSTTTTSSSTSIPSQTPTKFNDDQPLTASKPFREALAILSAPSFHRSKGTNTLRNFPSIRHSKPETGLDGKPTTSRTTTPEGKNLYSSHQRYDTGVLPADMPYLHHRNHDEKPKPKFKSPRKRASKLLNELQTEAVQKSKESKPAVWNVPFRVGDAVELEVLDSGGVENVKNNKLDKVRGVVLGRENKGLDTAIYLKDVLFGEHVERKIKLHSPMVKSLKVLEENFVFKGKRKVKRAKLYYLRDRKPEETRVTKI